MKPLIALPDGRRRGLLQVPRSYHDDFWTGDADSLVGAVFGFEKGACLTIWDVLPNRLAGSPKMDGGGTVLIAVCYHAIPIQDAVLHSVFQLHIIHLQAQN